MGFFTKAEETGHELAAEFEAFIASHKVAVDERVDVVKHRLEELESEHKALSDLLKKIGL